MSYFMKHYRGEPFTEIYNADSFSRLVYDNIKYYQDKAAEATARANKTREEVAAEIENKWEEENKQLKKRLRLSYLEFETENELREYNDFCREHEKCGLDSKINSGKVPYLIPYYHGIGRSLKVVCPICNEHKDIADIGAW